MTKSSHTFTSPKQAAATKARNFRTFLLMQQFAAREIGERIKQARLESGGMTQEQLAELLNVSTRSVQDYESGTTIPWKHMQPLARVFNRPLEWFLHGTSAPGGPDGVDSLVLQEVRRVHERLDELERLLRELPSG